MIIGFLARNLSKAYGEIGTVCVIYSAPSFSRNLFPSVDRPQNIDIANSNHHSRSIIVPHRVLVDETDFGDLKASLETALVDIFSLINMALDALFEKPAKIVVLLSILPSVINTTTKTTENMIRRFNEFPPDLVDIADDSTIPLSRRQIRMSKDDLAYDLDGNA